MTTRLHTLALGLSIPVGTFLALLLISATL
jgi:hypothetical protein